MKKSIYTTPKLCRASQGWYVYFRYNKKLFRYKFGINYIKNLSEREKEANALAAALKMKLAKGWNPLIAELPELGDDMTIIDALTFCLDKKSDSIAKKTYSGYKGTVKFISESIYDLNLNLLNIKKVKRAHIRVIIDQAKKINNWSNKARNKHLNHLKAILSELIDFDILEDNPAHKIKNLKVEQTIANRTPTFEEQKKIKDYLYKNHYNFFVYVATIYHTGIRPWELLQLKVENINFKQSEITLPAPITKSRKERIVPINNNLKSLLLSIGVTEVDPKFNVFASFRVKGRGNNGPKLDFIPGPTQLKRDTATKRWKKLIKDGLGINVNLYAEKHAGADDKIIAGMDLDSLRSLYGHESKFMTTIYAKKVKEIYKKDIISNSPKF